MDLAFQPTVHQLYEDELFPELEFSRKYSENSQLEAPHEHDSSMELPKFADSDRSDDGENKKGARGRRRHRASSSEGSHNFGAATSQQFGRRVSPMNLRRENFNDRDGDALDNSDDVHVCHHSSRINDENNEFKNGAPLEEKRNFK